MKPVALIERALNNSSDRGWLVLDPFAGSGSTLIACHTTGRVARLVELDPRYVDVICRRYQEATGDKPVLESSGEPHDFTG
jgi:DNA modification methylase